MKEIKDRPANCGTVGGVGHSEAFGVIERRVSWLMSVA
jgi:hypothetical protein